MKAVVVACVLMTVASAALWLWSGAETFSKSGKAVTVQRVDAFGDPQEVVEMRPGPLAGYYLGLDVVAGVILGSILISGGVWGVRRLLARRGGVSNHGA